MARKAHLCSPGMGPGDSESPALEVVLLQRKPGLEHVSWGSYAGVGGMVFTALSREPLLSSTCTWNGAPHLPYQGGATDLKRN